MRGAAVIGIFAMNVVGMALPVRAYADPTVAGGAGGLDLAAWWLAFVAVDGKMRALFTMLFGASLLLAAGRAEADGRDPVRDHYARMAWLAVFGMIHGWLFWYGDILFEYALVGALAFGARGWRTGALLYAAALLFALDLGRQAIDWHDLATLQRLAAAPAAPADAVALWRDVRAFAHPDAATLAREIALYRGGFGDAFAARRPVIGLAQAGTLAHGVCSSLAICLLGMALHRTGFWAGRWSHRARGWTLLAALPCLAGTALLASAIVAGGFDPVERVLADALSQALRLPIALGYAVALIALAGRDGSAAQRLGAAGRMAFSNYLGTTLVMTTLFYGYGLGLFAQFGRAALHGFVALQAVLILWWSPAWLARFRHGPLEWLWRSLARQERLDMRRTAIAKDYQ